MGYGGDTSYMMFLHTSVSVSPSLSRHGSSFYLLHKLMAFDWCKHSTFFSFTLILSGDLTLPNKQLFHDFFVIQAY
jgi:hypothetical protein